MSGLFFKLGFYSFSQCQCKKKKNDLEQKILVLYRLCIYFLMGVNKQVYKKGTSHIKLMCASILASNHILWRSQSISKCLSHFGTFFPWSFWSFLDFHSFLSQAFLNDLLDRGNYKQEVLWYLFTAA